MRDPEGTLSFRGDSAIRRIRADSPSLDFLRSGLASSLAASGKLIPYEFAAGNEIRSPKQPFVSYPFEWCDAQLSAAARLTLELSREILPASFELKDASAWNVLFAGTRPVFCDHLSFQRVTCREWWAFGQYARHFILPLAVSRLTGFNAHNSFLLNRDGLLPATARSLLGWRRFLSRYWPLMLNMTAGGRGPSDTAAGRTYHHAIYKYCELNIPRRIRARGSHWSSYTDARPHYPEAATKEKLSITARWLSVLRPAWVIDLGCNTGECSRLAAECGSDVVVSIDADHDSVQKLYASQPDSPAIHAVVANLADLPGGRGWLGQEAEGLFHRLSGRADLVLCEALLHHLAISEGAPLREIASMIANMTRAHAIVEFIDHSDPQLRLLAAQRRRQPSEFAMARQKEAFAEFFEVETIEPLPATRREVAILRKRPRSKEPPA